MRFKTSLNLVNETLSHLHIPKPTITVPSCSSGAHGVKLHIADNQNVFRQVTLGRMIANSSLENQVKHSLKVSICTFVMTFCFLNLSLERPVLTELNELRGHAESNVLVSKSTLSTVSAINCQRIGNVQTGNVTSTTRQHGTRTISHNEHRLVGFHQIGQSLPHTFQSGIRIRVPTRNLMILIQNLARISNRSINLGFTTGQAIQISSTASFIVLQESLIVIEVGLRRNCLVINRLPVVRGHLTLNNVNMLTHSRQHLTILLFSHTKSVNSPQTVLTGLLTTRGSRIQPLSHQRDRLASLHIHLILSNLTLKHLLNSLRSNRIRSEVVNHIPATILRNEFDNLRHNLSSTILHHILKDNHRRAALTLTLTNIHQIAKPTHSQTRILSISLTEQSNNLPLFHFTHGGNLEVNVNQSGARRLICNSTVFGQSQIRVHSRKLNLLIIQLLTSLLHLVNELALTRLRSSLVRLLRSRSPSLLIRSVLLRSILVIHN